MKIIKRILEELKRYSSLIMILLVVLVIFLLTRKGSSSELKEMIRVNNELNQKLHAISDARIRELDSTNQVLKKTIPRNEVIIQQVQKKGDEKIQTISDFDDDQLFDFFSNLKE